MARKTAPIGPSTLNLIEDARVDLVRAVLALREGDNEPDFQLQSTPPEAPDDEAVDAFRRDLIKGLSVFNPDELWPAEQRCRRIRALADGKGVASLTTIVDRQFDEERSRAFENQPDPLCRSIWTFLNARQTFEDAESFHSVRQFRDYGKFYDAFEVELETAGVRDAASIDEDALAAKVTSVLELRTACTVTAIDLPQTEGHSASIMLIVRHGGPLSSVSHRYGVGDQRRTSVASRAERGRAVVVDPGLG